MRIVAGKFAGRHLTPPADSRVRPTAESVRAGMLDLLAPDLAKARVLDLFAGTGALGLEALSRGARYADFVEFRPSSLHALKANVAALRLLKCTRIFKKDVVPFVSMLQPEAYDIAFVDPPYESQVLELVLGAWRERRFARILAVEHARDHRLPKGSQQQMFPECAVTIYRL
ncbi:MAG: RsmD family RNA methyltransferase [Gammaproteobacteria bacterium]